MINNRARNAFETFIIKNVSGHMPIFIYKNTFFVCKVMRSKWEINVYNTQKKKNILNVKNSTNHGFIMDNGYELNWLLRSGLVLKINKDSKIQRSNS